MKPRTISSRRRRSTLAWLIAVTVAEVAILFGAMAGRSLAQTTTSPTTVSGSSTSSGGTTTSGASTTTTTTVPFSLAGPDFKVDVMYGPTHITSLKCGGVGGAWHFEGTTDFGESGIGMVETSTVDIQVDATTNPPSGPMSGTSHLEFTGLPAGITASTDGTLSGTATLGASGFTFVGVSKGSTTVNGLPIPIPIPTGMDFAGSLDGVTIPVMSGAFCPGSTTTSSASTTVPSSTVPPTSVGVRASGGKSSSGTASGGTATPGVALHTNAPGIPPGAPLVASVTGCDPGAAVQLDVGGGNTAAGTAGTDGSFSGTLERVQLPVGPHTLTMSCGAKTAEVPVAVVVQAAATPPGRSLLVVIAFVMLVPVLAYRMFIPARRRPS